MLAALLLLPRVLLIGDSISTGYTEPVREMLKDVAEVERIPVNGGPSTRGVESLEEWLGGKPWAVIHFNFGLHDLRLDDGRRQVPLEQYEENLRAIVKRLKATGAKLIWATTTPVPEGDLKPPRRSADVLAYNAVAKKIMEENGVEIDDLYSYALFHLAKWQRPVNVHFTDEGSAELAKQVAGCIRKALR